jgi:uncharacterized glyoxalase superfamily protein PhnB
MSTLPPNRSIPAAMVIPVLAYPDVRAAVAWLCGVFGFTERLQIAAHRSQLVIGDRAGGDSGAVIVGEYIDRARPPAPGADYPSHLVMVRIPDVAAHHARVVARGADVLHAPVDYPYGERQYTVRDLGGHRWTFSQTLADKHPNEWGGADVVLA